MHLSQKMNETTNNQKLAVASVSLSPSPPFACYGLKETCTRNKGLVLRCCYPERQPTRNDGTKQICFGCDLQHVNNGNKRTSLLNSDEWNETFRLFELRPILPLRPIVQRTQSISVEKNDQKSCEGEQKSDPRVVPGKSKLTNDDICFLTDDEFLETFGGVDRRTFLTAPKWFQEQAKYDHCVGPKIVAALNRINHKE